MPPHRGPPFIQICSLDAARDADLDGFGGVITIENSIVEDPLRIEGMGTSQLVLRFDDIAGEPVEDYLQPLVGQCILPNEAHVHSALGFGRKCGDTSLLIHCHAGMSRSPAIALAILADFLGPGNEEQAVEELLGLVRLCTPNNLVVEIADGLLGRQGKLVSAVKVLE